MATTIPECTFDELASLGNVTLVAKLANGKEVVLGVMDPRYFSTGSYGMGLNGKVGLPIGGKNCRLQASVNFTVIGSKGAAQRPVTDRPPAAAAPASVTPSGPAALWDKTTKQGTLVTSSEAAYMYKSDCGGGFYSRCDVITPSSPEWTVAKDSCTIPLAKGMQMV